MNPLCYRWTGRMERAPQMSILERSGILERASGPMFAALTVKERRVRQTVSNTALALKAERPEGPVKCPLWARRLAVVSS